MIPGDLVTDLDLLALDVTVLTDFGATSLNLAHKRQVAVSDWLTPRLETAGLSPAKHRTRRTPAAAFLVRSGVITDVTESLGQSTEKLASSMLATPDDYLVVGMQQPFRGMYIGIGDSVNAVAGAASLTYWSGRWSVPSSVTDDTTVANVLFAAGGNLAWSLPDDWFPRVFNNTMAYWIRLSCASSLSANMGLGQVLPITRSRLTAPTACYAMHLVYREASGSNTGQWAEKAKSFLDAANEGLAIAMPLVVDEFDIDNSNAVEPTEPNSLVATRPTSFTWERG